SAFCPTIFDLNVLALNVSYLFQSLPKRAQAVRVRVRRGAAKETEYRPRLLRARSKRPRGRSASNHFDELAPSHRLPPSSGWATYRFRLAPRSGPCPLWVKSGHFAGAIGMSALPPKTDIICGRALSASRQQVQETLTVFPAGYRRQTSSRSEVGYRKARSFHSPTKTLLSVLTVAGMARAQYTVSSRNSYRPTDL